MRIIDMYHYFLNFENVCDGFRSSMRNHNADCVCRRANNWGLWRREYGNPWTNWPNPERRREGRGDGHGRGTSGDVGAAGDWYKMEDGTRWRIGVGSARMVRPMGMML